MNKHWENVLFSLLDTLYIYYGITNILNNYIGQWCQNYGTYTLIALNTTLISSWKVK